MLENAEIMLFFLKKLGAQNRGKRSSCDIMHIIGSEKQRDWEGLPSMLLRKEQNLEKRRDHRAEV